MYKLVFTDSETAVLAGRIVYQETLTMTTKIKPKVEGCKLLFRTNYQKMVAKLLLQHKGITGLDKQ